MNIFSNKGEIDVILYHILNNTASVDEIKRFGVWIKKDGNKEYFNSIKKIWHLYSNADISESEINNAWLLFKKELDKDLNKEKPKKYLSLVNSRFSKFVKYAAMIILIIGLYYIYNANNLKVNDVELNNIQTVQSNTSDEVSLILSNGETVNLEQIKEAKGGKLNTNNANLATTSDSIKKAELSQIKLQGQSLVYNNIKSNKLKSYNNKIVVPYGKKFHVVLSDGTKVWINSGSSIEYPIQFHGSKREVKIIGDVYFEVAKNPSMPFYVYSPYITTKVLGTSFEIESYEDGESKNVILVEGKVEVTAGNNKRIILPNRELKYNPKTKGIKESRVDARSLVCWKDGILRFRDLEFDNILKKIERWYGIKVVNELAKDSKLETLKYSGEFKNDSLEVVMQTICQNVNINYLIKDNTLYIQN